MPQDSIPAKQKHEEFLKKVCETEVVWTLKSSDGVASCSSCDYENDDGEPLELICFWSAESLAKMCINEDWGDYEPSQISLAEFIENWCIGMHNDGFLAGTNLDKDLSGFEIEPLELIVELSDELKIQKKEVSLENYKHIDDLVKELKELSDTTKS
ncbi:MAG: DUF2750 domain-containing protein [Fibrobacter sp.]|nr:DUF2750 domain-containing protein [Fibrobacter sp.]